MRGASRGSLSPFVWGLLLLLTFGQLSMLWLYLREQPDNSAAEQSLRTLIERQEALEAEARTLQQAANELRSVGEAVISLNAQGERLYSAASDTAVRAAAKAVRAAETAVSAATSANTALDRLHSTLASESNANAHSTSRQIEEQPMTSSSHLTSSLLDSSSRQRQNNNVGPLSDQALYSWPRAPYTHPPDDSWMVTPTPYEQRGFRDPNALRGAAAFDLTPEEVMKPFESANDALTWLASVLQQKIYDHQHPENCDNQRLLVCNLNKVCGWGCQFHHIIYSLMLALADGRVFVLESRAWSYFGLTKHERAFEPEQVPYQLPEGYFWEKFFEPVTSCSSNNFIRNAWPAFTNAQPGSRQPSIDRARPYYWVPDSDVPKMLTDKVHQRQHRAIIYWVPANMKAFLERFHPDPPVWFVGQLERYLTRMLPQFERSLQEYKKQLQIPEEFAAVHIRRTDKISEAAYHEVGEYMAVLQKYYEAWAATQPEEGPVLAVFVLSDEPQVLTELRSIEKSTGRFRFHFNPQTSVSAQVQNRLSPGSLKGLMLDVFLAGQSRFFVGTLSSQLGRVVYELRNSYYVDPTLASGNTVSLDEGWYFS